LKKCGKITEGKPKFFSILDFWVWQIPCLLIFRSGCLKVLLVLLDLLRNGRPIFLFYFTERLVNPFATLLKRMVLPAVENNAGFTPVTISLQPLFIEKLVELSILVSWHMTE